MSRNFFSELTLEAALPLLMLPNHDKKEQKLAEGAHLI